MLNKLSENTLVPLSMVGAIVGSIVGGCIWLTTLWYQSNANAEQLKSISVKQDKYAEDIMFVKEQLIGIRLELKRLNNER